MQFYQWALVMLWGKVLGQKEASKQVKMKMKSQIVFLLSILKKQCDFIVYNEAILFKAYHLLRVSK